MTEGARFDAQAIEMLRRVGGDDLVKKLAQMFCETAPLRISKARAALGRLDAADFSLAAHSLKSSAAQMGAARLQRLSARLEAEIPTEASRDSIVHMLDLADAEILAAAEWMAGLQGPGEAASMTRIAVVEDNADNMLLVRLILQDSYEVDEYTTGIAALDGMRASPPALALLDISLPGMDGLEVLSRMRTSDDLRPIPVIALTAHAGPSDRERFLAAGFDDYVTKPIVDETQLLGAISRLLGKAPPK